MKKKLGFWSVVLLTINSIIGSGIFLSPGSVVLKSGTLAPVVYFCAALFAAILAIVFASAAKYVSAGGAAYAYAKTAFGNTIGFYVGITRFIAASIAWGVMATAVIKTVLSIFNLNNSDFGLITIGFVVFMVLLLVVNLFGPKLFEMINNLSTVGKLLALLTTIVFGTFLVIKTGTNNFSSINSFTNASGKPLIPHMNLSKFVMATITAFYAFTGFESVASGSEDMDQPAKNLPRAIPLGILVVAIINTGVVVVAMMLNPRALIETKEVVALVAVFDNPIIKNIILYGALISMFGINVAASFHTPRILEAIAKEKQIPKWFSKRTKKGVPLNSFLVTVLISTLLPMAFGYDMTNIIILSSISRFIQFLVVPISVIIFFYGKNREPVLTNVKRNFVTDVIFPVIGFVFTIFLLINFEWQAQFTVAGNHNTRTLNIFAIVAMAIGYIILPLILFLLNDRKVEK